MPGAAPATAPEEFAAVTEHAGRIGTRRIAAQAAELQSADETASAD